MVEKITLIGTLPPIKGISDTCLNQVKYLTKHVSVNFIGFKSIYPEFLYPGGSTKEENEIFQVEENENLKIKNLLTWYNPFSWIWAGLITKGEIVHFHWWTFYLFPIFFVVGLLVKIRGRKLICEIHNVLGHESSRLDKILTKLIFKLSDYLIVHSENNKKQLEEFFGIKKRIFVIPLGTLNFFNDSLITKTEARNKLNLPDEDKIILNFGNIRKYKGVDILIKAFAIVKQEIPNTKLVIAGSCWVDWQPFQRLIEENNLESCVIIDLRFISASEVKHYFIASDLVVLPYLRFEAQSGPGRIALAFNKPLVITDVGGLSELVKDRDIIVKSGDEKALAQAVIKILKDEILRTKLENDSKELAQEYSWDQITEKTINLYNNLS